MIAPVPVHCFSITCVNIDETQNLIFFYHEGKVSQICSLSLVIILLSLCAGNPTVRLN